MKMYFNSETGLLAALISAPLVFLFVLLFNAYRLGKFERSENPSVNKRNRVLAVCGMVLIWIAIISAIIFVML